MPCKRTYGRAWLVTLLFTVAIFSYAYKAEIMSAGFFQHPRIRAFYGKPRPEGIDFFMVCLPEALVQYNQNEKAIQANLDSWLDALLKAGYHPMRMSDIIRIVESGGPLPPRTVALFFNPGYRRTCELALPVLARHACPATIFTNEAALKLSDRRYLSYHALRKLRFDRGWDYGFSDNADSFSLEGVKEIGQARWSSSAGAMALNCWGAGGPFNFLTADPDWTAQEFVDRLNVETPLSGPAVLTKTMIRGHNWGMVSTASEGPDQGFNLNALPANRGIKLFWLATMGENNFALHAAVKALYGELWLQLRYDEKSGDSISLMLRGRELIVEEEQNHHIRRLARMAQPKSFNSKPFAVDVTAEGERMSVAVNGGAPRILEGLRVRATGNSVMQIYLSDKMRGTAKVNGLALKLEPKSAHADTIGRSHHE